MTEDEYSQLIWRLDENKTIGMDGVSPNLLIMAAHMLAGPLTKIFNLSIGTGEFLTKWKMERVTHICKP